MLKSLCLWLKLCSSITGPAYVIDGDTIVVEGYHVRLRGVDAEELSEPNGPKAKAALKYIIDNHPIHCKLTGERSYNRYIGTCDIQGIDLALPMIAGGYALDCARYSGLIYKWLEPSDARNKLIQKPYCGE